MSSGTPKQQIAVQKFRPLKKDMQVNFRKIKWDLQDDIIPNRGIIEEFVRQAEIMTSYPGFGDDEYQPFVTTCRRLCQAEISKDIDAAKKQFKLIAEMRQHCHEKFRGDI